MKPLLRIRMELAAVRYVAAGEPIEALRRQPLPLGVGHVQPAAGSNNGRIRKAGCRL
jgi:hypothetical protein